jgi:hypothetical protein
MVNITSLVIHKNNVTVIVMKTIAKKLVFFFKDFLSIMFKGKDDF